MGIIESHADLNDDRDRILPVKVSVLIDEILNCNTVNEFLYDIAVCAFMAYAEDFYDVILLER